MMIILTEEGFILKHLLTAHKRRTQVSQASYFKAKFASGSGVVELKHSL